MAEMIKERRTSRGLTQRQLALLIGTDSATVSRWERGVFLPTVEHRDKLAAVLGGQPNDYRKETTCQAV